MEKQMSHEDAWHDFFYWIKTQDKWRGIPRPRKQYFYAIKSAIGKGRCVDHRIESVLREYAPGRYKFVVIKTGEQ